MFRTKWKEHYFLRIKDLIDQYQPDLMYTDGPIFFGEWGAALTAHHYNVIAKKYGGKVEAVWANKGKDDCVNGTCVLDLERGVVDRIWDEPWQTDTCIGTLALQQGSHVQDAEDRHRHAGGYRQPQRQPAAEFPAAVQRHARPEGTRDPRRDHQVDGGERRSHLLHAAVEDLRRRTRHHRRQPGAPRRRRTSPGRRVQRSGRKPLSAADIRFTQKGGTLYAFAMGRPEAQVTIPILAPGGEHSVGKIRNVEMLGGKGKLKWTQDPAGLTVETASAPLAEHAVVFKITGA